MSDTALGPQWWQTTDGKWHPPELRPPSARREPTSFDPSGQLAAEPTVQIEPLSPPVPAPLEIEAEFELHETELEPNGTVVPVDPATDRPTAAESVSWVQSPVMAVELPDPTPTIRTELPPSIGTVTAATPDSESSSSVWSTPIRPIADGNQASPAYRSVGLPPELQRMLPGAFSAPVAADEIIADGPPPPPLPDVEPVLPDLVAEAPSEPSNDVVEHQEEPFDEPVHQLVLVAEVDRRSEPDAPDLGATASALDTTAAVDEPDHEPVAEVRSITRKMTKVVAPQAPRTNNIPASIAARNADHFKGTREFPDLLDMALKGSSLADQVEVQYDASSLRRPASDSAAPKTPPTVNTDRNGKRWKRKGR